MGETHTEREEKKHLRVEDGIIVAIEVATAVAVAIAVAVLVQF